MCEHKFVFLRQFTREVSWHNWKKIDVYYCEKCLLYREVEKDIEQPRRW